jgi:hypothetical protein
VAATRDAGIWAVGGAGCRHVTITLFLLVRTAAPGRHVGCTPPPPERVVLQVEGVGEARRDVGHKRGQRVARQDFGQGPANVAGGGTLSTVGGGARGNEWWDGGQPGVGATALAVSSAPTPPRTRPTPRMPLHSTHRTGPVGAGEERLLPILRRQRDQRGISTRRARGRGGRRDERGLHPTCERARADAVPRWPPPPTLVQFLQNAGAVAGQAAVPMNQQLQTWCAS